MPQWNALIGVSFMMFINFCTIGIILQFVGITNFFFNKDTPIKELIIIMMIIGVYNFYQFIHDEKYLKIQELTV